MGLFAIKPSRVEDVSRQLALHDVSNHAQWIGPNDIHFYNPLDSAVFTADLESASVIKRFAFSLEKSVVDRRRVSSSTLGQAALVRGGNGNELALAVVVPVKSGMLAPTTEELVTTPMPEDIDSLGVFHTSVAHAILDVVQRNEQIKAVEA